MTCAIWPSELITLEKKIIIMLVPTATCGGNLNTINISGVINAPPPMPSNPVNIPINNVAMKEIKGGT